MEVFKEKAIKVYSDIAQLPSVEGARISRDTTTDKLYTVELKWKQKDIERGKNLGYAKSYVVEKTDGKMKTIIETSFQRDTTSM